MPRRANLSSRYDGAGLALSALPVDLAECVLDLVDSCCPAQPAALRVSDLLDVAAPATHAAIDAVWQVMFEQRGGRAARAGAPAILQPVPRPESSFNGVWEPVRSSLEALMAPDAFQLWIEPLALVDVVDDTVVVSAPNVFVRDQVAVCYAGALREALETTLGRHIQVELAIGG